MGGKARRCLKFLRGYFGISHLRAVSACEPLEENHAGRGGISLLAECEAQETRHPLPAHRIVEKYPKTFSARGLNGEIVVVLEAFSNHTQSRNTRGSRVVESAVEYRTCYRTQYEGSHKPYKRYAAEISVKLARVGL